MTDFFRKIWTALNSATQAKSLAFAIAFGMIVGLTPTFNIHNFLILFIVLIFNVHIGFFLVSIFLFNLIGFMFDPLFNQLGYTILNSAVFEQFFTYLYNLPYFRLTNFNNTIVMGSLLVSVTLFPLVYFVFRDLIVKYRDMIVHRFNNVPILRWFFYTPKDDEKAKKLPLIRVWGVAVFLGISGLIVAFAMFLLEPLTKYIITKSVKTATNRVATIDRLNIDFSNARFEIDKFAILNKKMNKHLFKIEKIGFDFEFAPMFDKKAIINLVEIKGIDISPQATVIYQESKEEEDKNNNKQEIQKENESFKKAKDVTKDVLNDLKFPSVSEVLGKEDIKSIKKAQQIEKELDELKKLYSDKGNIYDKKKISSIKNDIKSLKKDIKKIRSLDDLKKVKINIDSIQERIEIEQTSIKTFNDKFTTSYKKIQIDIKKLKPLLEEDYKKVGNKYSMDKDGAFEFIKTIAGDKAYKYAKIANDLYDRIKPYIQSGSQKVEIERYRDKGYFVKFKNTTNLPTLYIKKMIGDVTYDKSHYEATMSELSSDKKAGDVPMVVDIVGKSPSFRSFDAKYMYWFKNRWDPMNRLVVAIGDLKVNNYIVDKKLKLNSSKVDLRVDVNGRNYAAFDLWALSIKSKAHFKDSDIESHYNKYIDEVFKEIKEFDVDSSAFFEKTTFEYDIKSNIDDKIKAGLKVKLKQKEKEFKAKLRAKLDKRMQKELDKLHLNNEQMESIKKAIAGDSSELKSMSKDLIDNYKNQQKSILNAKKAEAKAKLEAKKRELKRKKAEAKAKLDAKKKKAQAKIDKKKRELERKKAEAKRKADEKKKKEEEKLKNKAKDKLKSLLKF
jgi:uncharacterized protein (TIGR03545 family)/uncharacterized protein (TIGR03546 family)